MVLGLGLDIIDVSAFSLQLEEPASCFVESSFTFAERQEAESRVGSNIARHLAVRYAAKEAFIKAWSLALRGQPLPLKHVDMQEIELVSDAWKRPHIRLHGVVAETVRQLGVIRTTVSLSHDGGYAAAVILIEQTTQEQEAGSR